MPEVPRRRRAARCTERHPRCVTRTDLALRHRSSAWLRAAKLLGDLRQFIGRYVSPLRGAAAKSLVHETNVSLLEKHDAIAEPLFYRPRSARCEPAPHWVALVLLVAAAGSAGARARAEQDAGHRRDAAAARPGACDRRF